MKQCSQSLNEIINSTNKEGAIPKIFLQEDGSFSWLDLWIFEFESNNLFLLSMTTQKKDKMTRE